MVRALLICSLYNIASFHRLCSAISENIAYRWFCFLTIDDPVFDHSSISHFIDRIGRDGFAAIFDGLNHELLRLGMLSPEMYVDSSLVKANVSGYGLEPSGMSVAEFKEQAIEENGLFVLTEATVDDDGVEHEEVRYFQSPEGRMPLNPVDTDARWKTTRAGKASGLQHQENVIVDLGGFILSRGVTHASERESKVVAGLLEGLPLLPVSLAGETGYSDGRLRHLLEEQDITAYIPIHPKQETSMVASGDFVYHGDHLICPQDKTLRRGAYHKRQRSYQYVARQKDCQACPIKNTCLPPGQNRRFFAVTLYHPEYSRARERNRTAAYRRERRRRQTIVEGTFASLDRLGWARLRLRGLWKVEGGLRGVHGRAGPQRAEDGAEIGAPCRATRSGGARRRDFRYPRACRRRCGGQFRHAVMVLCLGKLVDLLPQARATVDLLSIRRLSQRTRPRRFTEDRTKLADVARSHHLPVRRRTLIRCRQSPNRLSCRPVRTPGSLPTLHRADGAWVLAWRIPILRGFSSPLR